MKSPRKILEEIGSAFDVCLDVDDELVEWFNRERSKVNLGESKTSEKGDASDYSACHDATQEHG